MSAHETRPRQENARYNNGFSINFILADVAMSSVIYGFDRYAYTLLLPGRRLARHGGVKPELERRLFARASCDPLDLSIFVYGPLMSVHLIFSAGVIVTAGQIEYPTDRLLRVLLGIAGLPAVLTGEFIRRIGVRAFLVLTMPTCGLSCLLLAAAGGAGRSMVRGNE